MSSIRLYRSVLLPVYRPVRYQRNNCMYQGSWKRGGHYILHTAPVQTGGCAGIDPVLSLPESSADRSWRGSSGVGSEVGRDVDT